MKTISYSAKMTYEEYNELRELVGFFPLTQGQAKRGLANTTFLAVARCEGRIVGMGRILFDFGYTAYIGDIIIHPEFQRQGIGTNIVKSLINQTLKTAEPGDKIIFILGAAKGKEPFYEKMGFNKRPNEKSGCGMTATFIKSGEISYK